MTPETRYAKTVDGVHIAYQVLGDGPMDLVFGPGFVSNVEAGWEWPDVARFLRRIATFSRLILFDRRGTGLSDHIVRREEQLTLEARMDDVRAVMDAAGSPRAVLLGFEEAVALDILFAATFPERAAALVTYAATPRSLWAPDFPWGWTHENWDAYLEDVANGWGTEAWAEKEGAEIWPDPWPDPSWIRHYATLTRRACSPGDAAALLRIDRDTDVRDLLGSVQAPTLVIHRTGDIASPVEQSRYMAARIPGAQLVELAGRNHAWMSPDQDEVVDQIERFLETLRAEEAAFSRVLSTVLFTDIVGSTERAAGLGDHDWGRVLTEHHRIVRGLLGRYRGSEIDTAGDGFFATFDGPARAVRCAQAIVEAVRALDIEIRAGVHTGEVETIDGKVGGIAVAIGSRVGSEASSSEVLVSSTVKDLVAGSGLEFEDRGEHELKGVPDRWRLYRVVS